MAIFDEFFGKKKLKLVPVFYFVKQFSIHRTTAVPKL
jgi:hypothetical protein